MLGLRYAKAANEAGHSWRCGGLGRVRWFTANIFKIKDIETCEGDVENGMASS